MLSGTRSIEAYGKQDVISERFNSRNETAMEAYYRAEYYGATLGPSVNFINNLSMSLVAMLGGILYMLSFGGKVAETSIFFFEHAEYPLREIMEKRTGGKIAMMVGSEGGFSDDEAKFASEHGVLIASLGPRILRCETAPVAALSAIMYAAGEMEIK